jgi:glycogen(starch) synthase
VRILFVTPLYLPWIGGLEVLASQLVAELHDRGHEVAVLTAHEPGEEPRVDVVGGVEVVRTAAHDAIEQRDMGRILAVQRDTWNYVRDFAPDVVHGHDAAPSLWLSLRAGRHRHPPVIMTLHIVMTTHYASVGGSLAGLRTVMRESAWLTGVSSDVVDDALTIEPSVADRISVLPNGVPLPADPPPVGDGPARLLCIGRLVAQKGFDRAVRAFGLLAPRHPDARLTIVGAGPDRAELVALAEASGAAERIEFLGEVDHARTAELFAAATAVVMPSRFEGLPLVALEAAAHARPVVGTHAPGLSRAVDADVTGLLVEGDDDAALADALAIVVADRARARSLGAAARDRAEREFSLAHCVDRYLELYEQVARAPSG